MAEGGTGGALFAVPALERVGGPREKVVYLSSAPTGRKKGAKRTKTDAALMTVQESGELV